MKLIIERQPASDGVNSIFTAKATVQWAGVASEITDEEAIAVVEESLAVLLDHKRDGVEWVDVA